MKIAGLEPLTLQDYPGEIAAVIFTAGCNLRCPYCHNPELVRTGSELSSERNMNQKNYMNQETDLFPEKEILDFLKDRQQYLDAVVISGGEPLIQPDLVDFSGQIKELGYKIRLDTNGTLPLTLQQLLDQELLDMVGWDYKLPHKRYQELTVNQQQNQKITVKIFQTGELLSQSGIPLEIRTTAVPGLLTAEDIEEIAREISEHKFSPELTTYVIQGFRNQRVLDQSFSKITPYSLEKLQEFKKRAEKQLADNNITDVIIRKNI